MTVRMLFWAITEIAIDIVLLYIVLSNSMDYSRHNRFGHTGDN